MKSSVLPELQAPCEHTADTSGHSEQLSTSGHSGHGEANVGMTYKELADAVGKSTRQVKYAVGRVQDFVTVEIHCAKSDRPGSENRLSDEGAALVMDYLEDSGAFKAKWCKALTVQQQEDASPIAVSESQDVSQTLEDQYQTEAARLSYQEVLTEALTEVSLVQERVELKAELVRKLSLENRKQTAQAKLQAALTRYQSVQSGKLEKVEQLAESNNALQKDIDDALGKLGISISLPWN